MADDESKFVPREEIGGPQEVAGPEAAVEGQAGQTPETPVAQPQTPEQTQVDFVLTPEIERMVMEKVQDITAKDTALTALRGVTVSDRGIKILISILRNGLLGGVDSRKGLLLDNELRNQWREKARKRKAPVFVNFKEHHQEIEEMAWIGGSDSEVSLILDLRKYKEVIPQQWYGSVATQDKFVGKTKTVRADMYGLGQKQKSLITEAREIGLDQNASIGEFFDFVEKNRANFKMEQKDIDYVVDSYKQDGHFHEDYETGYVVTPRVAPRDIQGIILRPTEQQNTSWNINMVIEIFKKKLRTIVHAMAETDRLKLALMVPIYDTSGNLVWPKWMSNGEVKKFVAEREAKKANPSPGAPRHPLPEGEGKTEETK